MSFCSVLWHSPALPRQHPPPWPFPLGLQPWSGLGEALLKPLPPDVRHNIQAAFAAVAEAFGNLFGGQQQECRQVRGEMVGDPSGGGGALCVRCKCIKNERENGWHVDCLLTATIAAAAAAAGHQGQEILGLTPGSQHLPSKIFPLPLVQSLLCDFIVFHFLLMLCDYFFGHLIWCNTLQNFTGYACTQQQCVREHGRLPVPPRCGARVGSPGSRPAHCRVRT